MGNFSRREVLAGAVLFSLTLSACGTGNESDSARPTVPNSWDAVVEAAKKEGQVQLYFSIGQDVIDNLTAGFKKKYPDIGVDVYRSAGGSNTLIERMENDLAARSWIADVVDLASPLWLQDALKREIVATDVQLPSADAWDPKYWKDGTMVLTPTVMGVAYNTDLVTKDEVPKSWADMRDARWKDRMGFWEPRPDTDSHTNLYEYYLETFGQESITDIMKLNPRFWDEANSLVQGIAAGESAIGPGFLHKIEALKEQGAPIDYVELEPAPTFLNTTFVASESPHPNAARVFMDYALSIEGQTAVAGDRRGNSVLDVPGAIKNPDEMYIPDINKTAKDYDLFMELIGRS